MIDKEQVLEALRARVEESLQVVTESQKRTQAGATHDETRPEDAKDTRATEATYLARGLAQRSEDLRTEVIRLDTLKLLSFGEGDAIAITALIGLEDAAGRRSVVFISPAGAGETLEIAGQVVRPLSPGSPLGRALLGRSAGDHVEVELPSGSSQLEILWVS